jgi:hypothetical protein
MPMRGIVREAAYTQLYTQLPNPHAPHRRTPSRLTIHTRGCAPCIMHSRRVGFLNLVLVGSVYFGFTNSSITPAVSCSTRVYESIAITSWLMFAGYGERPVCGSGTSPKRQRGKFDDENKQRRASVWSMVSGKSGPPQCMYV